jgi:hypothetical protein
MEPNSKEENAFSFAESMHRDHRNIE